jgi:hypothetical protein
MGGRRRIDGEFWTKERVINGLERFIRDIAQGDESKLPASCEVYHKMIPQEDRDRSLTARLYPPYAAVLRHFETFTAAWWSFGYLVEVKAKNPKYVLTDEIRDMLYKIYDQPFRKKDRPADLPGVKQYARQLGLPEHVLTKWAVQLGLSHVKEPPWSDEEIRLLDEFGYRSPDNLVQVFKKHGFTRSKLGILLMRKRRMSHKVAPYYSANALARLMGVDAHVVKAWIEKGWLKYVMKGTARGTNPDHSTGDTHLIHEDWLYDFICKHPTDFQLKKVDQLWFLHIVTKGDVKLSVSDPTRITPRMECHQLAAPVEHRKRRSPQAAKSIPQTEPQGSGLPYLRTDNAEDKPHGTLVRYTMGCRCDECKAVKTSYGRERKEAQRNGKGNPRVPADAARAHLALLSDAGIGYLRVSELAGVNHNIVWKIRTGERKHIMFTTEQKILSITPDDISDSTTIDASETWKKIDWLLAHGFTKTSLAQKLGLATPALQIGKKLVMRKTARRIEEIYNEAREQLSENTLRRAANG